MRVAVAGAGAVGRSIGRELGETGHSVMLIERCEQNCAPQDVPGAHWLLADACEVASLEDAELQTYDVMIAATGDDKVNLVVSLLAKTEFAIRRVVARVNEPRNEWLFNDAWGIDVAVSTPRMLSAMVEEAVNTGDLVRLMTLRQGHANLVEVTLHEDTRLTGLQVRNLELPADAALVAILRAGAVVIPKPDHRLEAGDELLFVTKEDWEDHIRAIVHGG